MPIMFKWSEEPFKLYVNLERSNQNNRLKSSPRIFSAVARLRPRRVRASDTGRASSVSRGVRQENALTGMGSARNSRRIFKNFLFPFTITYDLPHCSCSVHTRRGESHYVREQYGRTSREHHVCLIKSALSVRTSTSRQVRGFICCNHTARLPSIMFVCAYIYMYIFMFYFLLFPPSFRYWPSSRPSASRPLSTSSVCRFFFFIPFRTGNRARQLTGGGRKKLIEN